MGLDSPAKQYYAISLKSGASPVCWRRWEAARSDITAFLKALYKGYVFTTSGYYAATVGHHLMVLAPQCSGGIVAFYYIVCIISVAARGYLSILWKKRQHYLWHNNCTLSQLPSTYNTLLRTSHFALSAQRINSLAKSSASRNARPEAVTHICISLKQAYSGAANNKTDTTKEETNYSLILQFYNPSNCALFLIFKKAILAYLSLCYSIWTGDFAFEIISTPKYLNTLHYCNSYWATYNCPVQFTSITSVFLVFITRSFYLQKSANTEINFYNYSVAGAIRTISSAKANIKRFKHPMVNSLFYWRV